MMGNDAIFEAGKEKYRKCTFETEASGKPTSSFDAENLPKNRCVKRYISIYDGEVWELIDKIMTIPDYKRSFNKVVNHALKFGIVELYEKLFVKENELSVEDIEELNVESLKKTPEEKNVESYLMEVGNLMKENIVYLSIIKSVVCSLFNGRLLELGGHEIPQKKYADGAYRRTPAYLEAYENRAFKNVRGNE